MSDNLLKGIGALVARRKALMDELDTLNRKLAAIEGALSNSKPLSQSFISPGYRPLANESVDRILNALTKPMTVIEVAETTGYHRVTASQYLSNLLRQGAVRRTRRATGKGMRPYLYERVTHTMKTPF